MREGTGARDNKRILYLLFLAIAGVLFFFCIGDRSYLLYKDSSWFIDRSKLPGGGLSYILYPEFLRLCRILFGENEDIYLGAAACIQGVLGLITSVVFAEYIRRAYDLRYITSAAAYAAVLGMYAWSLPEAVSTHYIITEGLAYPICIVMFVCVMEYFRSHKISMLLVAVVLDIMMSLIRPQMMLFIPVTALALVLRFIYATCKGERMKKAVVTFLSALGLISAGVLFAVIAMLTYISRSSYPGQFENAIIGKAVCLMEEDDRYLYEGYEQEIFDIMYTEARDSHRLQADFPESVLEYEKLQRLIDRNVYDHDKAVWEYMQNKSETVDAALVYNMIHRIAVREVSEHKGRFSVIVCRLLPSSLVASIFFQPPGIRLFCYVIALLLYVYSLVLMFYAIHKEIEEEYIIPLAIALLFILCNVLSCNVILYGQQRYMVYCFGVFYGALLVLTGALIRRMRADVEKEHEE